MSQNKPIDHTCDENCLINDNKLKHILKNVSTSSVIPKNDDQIINAYRDLVTYPRDLCMKKYHDLYRNNNKEFALVSFMLTDHVFINIHKVSKDIKELEEFAKELLYDIDAYNPKIIIELNVWKLIKKGIENESDNIVRVYEESSEMKDLSKDYEKMLKTKEMEAMHNLEKRAELLKEEIKSKPNDLDEFIVKLNKFHENDIQIEYVKQSLDLLMTRKSLISGIIKKEYEKYKDVWFDHYVTKLKEVGIKEVKLDKDLNFITFNDEYNHQSVNDLQKQLADVEYKYLNLKPKTA